MRLAALCCLALASIVLPNGAEAQLASMVSDLRTTADPGGSAPVFLGSASGIAYFTAETPTLGRGLWASDGTPEGTRPLASPCPATCSAGNFALGQSADRLFLARSHYSDGAYADALLLATGSPPALLPVLIESQAASVADIALPGHSALLDGNLLFTAKVSPDTFDLYATEGVAGQYVQLHRFEVSYGVGGMTRAGSLVYFWASSSTSPTELWSTDGTAAGTRFVTIPDLSYPGEVAIGTPQGTFVFTAQGPSGFEVWASDGSAAGTRRLTDFADPNAKVWSMAASPERVFFYVEDLTFGQEIWATDGTPERTRPVTSFGYHQPFGGYYSRKQLLVAGRRAYFLATTGVEDVQLWTVADSGGEPAPIADVCAELGCFYDQELRSTGDQVFFVGLDGRLWTTDGSPSGTRVLDPSCAGPCGGFGSFLTTSSGRVVYTARLEEIAASTVFVAAAPWTTSTSLFDPLRGAPTIDPYGQPSAVDDGDTIFFAALDSTGGAEPWASRFGSGATFQLADISGAQEAGSSPHGFAGGADRVAFRASDSNYGEQFWTTDGSQAGTRQAVTTGNVCLASSPTLEPLGDRFVTVGCASQIQVLDPNADLVSSIQAGDCYYSAGFGIIDETLAVVDSCGGQTKIWRSDGTEQGTTLAFTVPGVFSVGSVFRAVNHHLLLIGGSEGYRLYSLSAAMTSLVPITALGAYPDLIVAPQGEALAFYSHAGRLWRTDGTVAGTFAVGPQHALLALGAAVRSTAGYDLLVQNELGEIEVWFSDGSSSGTEIRALAGPAFVSNSSVPLDRAGARLYFILPSYTDGPALWVLEDGSTTPLRLLANVPISYVPDRSLVHRGAREYFAACDAEHGCEMWISDGSVGGTRLLHDIAPGPASSNPNELYVAGDKVFFNADDGLHGEELWVLPLDDGPACRATDRNLCLENARFQASARWTDFAGRSGDAAAVPITGDTGYFWFFDDANVELILKLIDGEGFNGHHWVYYGALSNVEYTFTVTDSETGAAKRYFNPATRFASSGDITAFGPNGAHALGGPAEAMTRAATPPEVSGADFSPPQRLPGACVPTATRFCILNHRFAVTATWRDFAGHTGVANAGTLTDDTGYLWFFNEANVEVVLKMVDAGAFNQHFWVYYGALSNVEYTLTVTDTVAGGPPRVYHNALGQFGSFGDIEAFPAP